MIEEFVNGHLFGQKELFFPEYNLKLISCYILVVPLRFQGFPIQEEWNKQRKNQGDTTVLS